MLTPTVRRTYAPRGQTPIHRCWDRRDRISAISAITVSPMRRRLGFYFRLLPENQNVRAEHVVGFLRLLTRHIRNPLNVFWDRSNVHDRSKLVREFLKKHPRVITARFPAYAPELNPDEGVWSYAKYARLSNAAPADSDDLRVRVNRELKRLRKRTDLLASFIHHSELPLRI